MGKEKLYNLIYIILKKIYLLPIRRQIGSEMTKTGNILIMLT